MFTAKQIPHRKHGDLLQAPLRCLDRLNRMSVLRRCRALLVVRPAGQKGGAVVPPCDFQKCYTEIALYKGIYPYARPRNARPCVRSPT